MLRPAAPEALAAAPALFISPHLDDAVFACGRLLASLPGAVVVTVFAGRPRPGGELTGWDRAAGFAPGDDVVGRRRREDRRSLARLGAKPCWLPFLDSQYGGGTPPAALVRGLRAVCRRCAARSVFFPLGLFHSDHRRARAAALLLRAAWPGCRWLAYEDALYRRLDGERAAGLAALRPVFRAPRRLRFAEARGAGGRKAAAVACYRSQLRALRTPGRPGLADLRRREAYWLLREAA